MAVEYIEERMVGDLTIRIDQALCVGFEHCTEASPVAFRLDERAGVVEFERPEDEERSALIAACEACPVDALIVIDAAGDQLVP